MILLVAPSRRALPGLPIPTRARRMILNSDRSTAERQVRQALDSGKYDLLVSVGFAAAADRRLEVGDLLAATRVYGGADVYLDLPRLQTPGAVSGGLCTLMPDGAPPPRGRKRLPAVYAFDDHAFWLARAAQAAEVPCLVLRAMLLEAPADPDLTHPLAPYVLGGRLKPVLKRLPGRWQEMSQLARNIIRCRSQLATTLSVLLVLHGGAPPR